ncbi:MAG: molybdopterin-binding protein [Roseobacter sp.]
MTSLRAAVASGGLVLTTGGASVGRGDPIRARLIKTGATLVFHGFKMRPGNPLGFTSLRACRL